MKTQTYYTTRTEREANICNQTEKLCVNCAGVVNESYGIKTSSVRNDYYIIYMVEGSMHFKADSESSDISSGQAIIIKQGTPYRYSSEPKKNLKYYWIHFSGIDAEKTVLDLDLKLNTIINIGVHSRLSDSWKRLFYEFLKNDAFFSDMSCSILREILTFFSRYMNSREKKQHFMKSLFYIHENLNSDIAVDRLARLEGISEPHFRSEFKKSIGVSPKEYIIKLRIETACTLITDSNVNISEAARLVGYKDSYYFSRIFKKKMGISPLQYKKKHSETPTHLHE